jgi:predicted MFS family arabinose efflux permease
MTRSQQASLFTLFTWAYFLSFFLRSANAVIARDLSQTYQLSSAQLGFMTSVFFAGFAAMQLPIGAALDRFGARAVTASVLLLAVVGCLVFASADSFAMLAAGRALIGAGMACALMSTLKIYGAWFAERRFATISGLTVSIGALGGLLAATPLALANQLLGWRAIFVAAAAAVALAALLIALWARDAPRGHQATPAGGAAGNFAQVFGEPRFWRLAPLMFVLVGTTQSVQTLWGGPYVQDVLGTSAVGAGNALLAFGLGVAVGYGASGWLADRYGPGRIVFASGVAFTFSQAALALTAMRPSAAVIVIAFAVLGFSGSFNLQLLTQVRSFFASGMSGRATTACNLFGFAGTFAIQWALGIVIGLFPAAADGRYPPVAYAAAFACTLAASILALAWYMPLRSE